MKIDDLDSRVSVNIELLIWDREHFFVLILKWIVLLCGQSPQMYRKHFYSLVLGWMFRLI